MTGADRFLPKQNVDKQGGEMPSFFVKKNDFFQNFAAFPLRLAILPKDVV